MEDSIPTLQPAAFMAFASMASLCLEDSGVGNAVVLMWVSRTVAASEKLNGTISLLVAGYVKRAR
jgi:hypothetical protein